MTTHSLRPRAAFLVAVAMVSGLVISPALGSPPSAAAAECSVIGEGIAIEAPFDLYAVHGRPMDAVDFGDGLDDEAVWTGCRLPAGLSITASGLLAGTPAGEGPFELMVEGAFGSSIIEGYVSVLSADALDVRIAPEAAPYAGQEIALRPAGESGLPGGTSVVACWGEHVFASDTTADDGWFALSGPVPDVPRGPHTISVEFELPNGQRYTSELSVTVAALGFDRPGEIYPTAGTAVSHSFAALDAVPDVTYRVEGDLPPGLTLDADIGQLTGTPTVVGRTEATIVADDGERSASHPLVITVVAAGALRPPVLAPIVAFYQLPGLGSGAVSPDRLDDLIETANRQPALGPPRLPVGPDPVTGKPSLFIGSELEMLKEQNRRLEDAARAGEREAALEKQQAQLEERQKRAELEAIKTRLLAERAQERLIQELERQQAAVRAAAEEAQQRVRDAAMRQLENAEAQRALAERQRRLDERREERPLPAGTQVRLELHSTPVLLGTATVDATGGFLIQASVPAGTPAGNHHLVVQYTLPDGTVHTQSTAVIVEEAAAESAMMPATGVQNLPIALAAGLLGIGAALLVARHRRDSAA